MVVVTAEGAALIATEARDTTTAHRSAVHPLAATAARIVLDVVLVVWAAATLTFVALKLIPGDPLDKLMGGIEDATPAMRAAVAAQYGLDRPVFVQYLSYLGGVARGDLGTSYQRGAPVTEILLGELAPTVELTVWAMIVAILVSIGLAVATSGRRRSARLIAQGLEVVAVSTPSFWLGIVLMTVFSFWLRWVPAFGNDGPATLVLPVITLALPLIGVLTQVLRERMEHTLHEPFVTTLRARGLGEGDVRMRHVLRHASLPALTLSTVIFGSLLSGTAVIETLFARPGLGRLAVVALQDRDIPLVMGFVIFAAFVFIVLNTVVDLLYPVLDPRLRRRR